MKDIKIMNICDSNKTNEDIRNFIEKHYSNKSILTNKNFYEWNFMYNGEKDYSIIALYNKEIVGFIGVTKREFKYKNSILNGAELTSWVIKKDFRGNLGNLMIFYLKERYDVLIAMGISKMSLPVFLFNEFKYIKSVPRYVKIFNMKNICNISNISNIGKIICRNNFSKNNIKYNVKILSNINDNTYWEDFYTDKYCFTRDLEYLKKRYSGHPFFKYDYYEILKDNEKSLLVIRKDFSDGYNFAHIVDFIGNTNNLEGVIDFIDKYAEENKLDFVDIYCTDNVLGSYFWRNGWSSTLNDIDNIQIPYLFHPIELRIPPTNSVIIWSKYTDIYDLSKLYITKSDCDFDMPTLNYLNKNM